MSVAFADDVMLQEEGAPEMPGTEGTPEEGGESQPEQQPETEGGVALAEGEEEAGDKPEEEKEGGEGDL